MEPQPDTGDWQSAITSMYDQLSHYLVAYLPQIFGALLLLVAGWLVSVLLSRLTLSLLSLVNRLLQKLVPASMAKQRYQIKPELARMAGKLVFWLVMMFFIAACTSILGLNFFASWFAEILGYLPRLLAGLLIILVGYLLGNALSVLAVGAAETAGFQRSPLVGSSVKLAVIFTALVIGVEQLGINIQFVTTLFIVVVGVLTAGIALAFGLGARGLIMNIVGVQQALKHCRIKDHLHIAGVDGVLVEVSNTMLVVETEKGRTLVPGHLYLEQISHVSGAPGESGSDN